MFTSKAFHRIFSRAPLHRHIVVPQTRPIGLVCQLLYDRLVRAPEVGRWIKTYSLETTFSDLADTLDHLDAEAFHYMLSWLALNRMPNLVSFHAPMIPIWLASDLLLSRMQDVGNIKTLTAVSL